MLYLVIVFGHSNIGLFFFFIFHTLLYIWRLPPEIHCHTKMPIHNEVHLRCVMSIQGGRYGLELLPHYPVTANSAGFVAFWLQKILDMYSYCNLKSYHNYCPHEHKALDWQIPILLEGQYRDKNNWNWKCKNYHFGMLRAWAL